MGIILNLQMISISRRKFHDLELSLNDDGGVEGGSTRRAPTVYSVYCRVFGIQINQCLGL